MKALPKKLLPLTLFGIAVTSLFSVQPAQAYTVTLKEAGSNVVANGSGAFNLTGLTLAAFGSTQAGMNPSLASLCVATGDHDGYGGLSGPSSFGTGGSTFANGSSGDAVAIGPSTGLLLNGNLLLFVPLGYISGTSLSDSSIYNNATFASLGVTPGT